MADKCQVESVGGVMMGCQDTVCIHTKKICDSCIEEDIALLRFLNKN